MKHTNTRKQLVLSILSLLLCVSMLVGSTFAWFTDTATSGMNNIVAGNLDVELYAGADKVTENTALFDGVDLWEPGVVVYENLQIANVGTLALKYQLSVNFGEENATEAGHKLSEVLKIAEIDKIADNATRDEVMAAVAGKGTALNQFMIKGELLPGAESAEKTYVIFWEPNDNDIDNLYNLNNGQVANDGEDHLFIRFGVNLLATQLMHEEDSFGNDYDEFASFLPNAGVNDVSNEYDLIDATLGIGGNVEQLDLAFAMQFLPTETYEQAQASAYRYYHADFVIKSNKAVLPETMALAGYYAAFCEDYNNSNWVYLTSTEVVPANIELRLVDLLGGGDGTGNGNITVNYQEICKYGNDGIGFLCGAAEMNGGVEAGTVITVELRLYETTGDPGTTDGPKNIETGEFTVVGTYSYTF
mgnify:CR=1 FL=1